MATLVKRGRYWQISFNLVSGLRMRKHLRNQKEGEELVVALNESNNLRCTIKSIKEILKALEGE